MTVVFPVKKKGSAVPGKGLQFLEVLKSASTLSLENQPNDQTSCETLSLLLGKTTYMAKPPQLHKIH